MNPSANKEAEEVGRVAATVKEQEHLPPQNPLSNDAIVRLINGARAEVRSYRTLYFTFQGVAFLLPGLVHSNILEYLGGSTPSLLRALAIVIVCCWLIGVGLLTRGLLEILPVTTCRSTLPTNSGQYPALISRFFDGILISARKGEALDAGPTELSVMTSLSNSSLMDDSLNARRELVSALESQHSIMQHVAATRKVFLLGVGFLALAVCLSFVFRLFFALGS